MDDHLDTKAFLIRIPKDLWVFLKLLSIKEEKPVNKIINDCLENLKKNHEKDIDIT